MAMKSRKNNILRIAVSVLLGLTLISFYFISGTLAKYTSADESYNAALTAKWDVRIENTDGDSEISIVKGTDKSESAAVSFSLISISEVACEYDLLVYGVPKYVTVELYSGTGTEGLALSTVTQENDSTSVLSFDAVGEMPAGTNSEEYTLSFSASIEAEDSEEPLEITVGARFTQKG